MTRIIIWRLPSPSRGTSAEAAPRHNEPEARALQSTPVAAHA